MVRIYMTPVELLESPVGLGMSATLSSLGAGVLDKLLARASQRIDTFTNRRIQAPGSTTLSSNALAGDTSISVASTLTLDNGAEQAAIIGSGSTQETVLIKPGGVSLTGSAISPYPGVLQLSTPLQYAHSSGTGVQFCYQEVDVSGSVSGRDRFVDLELFPDVETLSFTRVCFVRNSPIIGLLKVEQADSLVNVYSTVDTSSLYIDERGGWYRVSIWQTLTPQDLLRTTYTGGYLVVPDDIKLACSYYLADEMTAVSNPGGLVELQMGKVRRKWGNVPGKSQSVCQAEEILGSYRAVL